MALALALPFVLAACSSVGDATRSTLHKLTPYKVEVVQGNFVSREQVRVLQRGMSRQQVREILGTPLLTSVFHADRWDYVFTIKRQGVPEQERRLTVFFDGDHFDRAQGDEMPSESEFVATLDPLGTSRGKLKIPPLEATPEQLAKHPAIKSSRPSSVPIAASVALPRLRAVVRAATHRWNVIRRLSLFRSLVFSFSRSLFFAPR